MYDFVKLKEIPISSILSHFNIQHYKRSDTEMVADCPLPSHIESSKEHTRTFSFGPNRKKGCESWFCHSVNCQRVGNHHGGDSIDLYSRLAHVDAKAAAKEMTQIFLQGQTVERREVKTSPSAAASSPERNKPLDWPGLQNLQHGHQLIQARGISPTTAQKYGIGFFPGKGSMAGRLVFKLYDEDGQLIGHAGRALDESVQPKWKLPEGLIKGAFLYGLNHCTPDKPLIVCESFWGPAWFHENGAQAASLMGTSLSEAQERLLDPFKTIHVCMDNDEAGRAASEKIAQRLKPKHAIFKAYLKD